MQVSTLTHSGISFDMGNTALATKDVKHGATVAVLSRKAYGERHSLKGAELRRKHNEYLRSTGQRFNVGISAALTKGTHLVQKITPQADGCFTARFVPANKLAEKESDKKAAAIENKATEKAAQTIANVMGISLEQAKAKIAALAV